MTKYLRISDTPLLFFTLLATGLGLLFIFDAGYARSIANDYGPMPKEFKGQLMFLPIAILIGCGISLITSGRWEKLAKWLWFASLFSLLLPLTPLGQEHNGAVRWFRMGPIEIQPAEFVKIAAILYLAAIFANRGFWPKRIKPPKHFADAMDRIWIPKLQRCLPLIWIVAAALLIEREPDMGTAFIVLVISFVMMFAGGVSRKSLILMGIVAVLGVGLLTFGQSYRMDRIRNHLDRWSTQNMDDTGYQTVQSEIALATGGVLGVGPGGGRAKHVLPAATTDFIMATVGEEFGIMGVLLVLCVLGALVIRLFQLAANAPNRFGSMVLMGVGAWIGIQTILNVMMVNATLPAIGVPLPFISSGGSSLIALWLGVGLCQAVLQTDPEPSTEVEKSAPRRNRWRNRRTRLSGS
jgi:cell division protein FtsW